MGGADRGYGDGSFSAERPPASEADPGALARPVPPAERDADPSAPTRRLPPVERDADPAAPTRPMPPIQTDVSDQTLQSLLRRRRRFRGPRHGPASTDTDEFPTRSLVREEPWPGRVGARLLVLLNLFFTAAYIGWWSVGGHVGNPVLFALLAIAETFTIVHLSGLWQSIWKGGVDLPPPGRTWFSIDVFIPTYGEPLSVLRRTISSAVAMEGPHRTYVLDDAVRDEVRDLAHELNAYYIPRESTEGAKAGNLNNALARTDGDLLVVFDADHVARRDFLTHLVGYFEDREVALVQSPQFYGNAIWNPVARGAWDQQAVFYGPIKRGKHGLGSAFLCGTNAIIRRAALLQVGGFDQTTVTEDVATSLQLHRRGWKTVYFPFVLAEGEGPPSIRQYFAQQLRWAHGSISTLLQGGPFKLGLRPFQRLQYLFSTTYYFNGFVTLIYLTLPWFALFWRIGPFASGATTFYVFYIPHIVVTLVNLRRELQGEFGLRHLQFTFGSFPIYIKGALAALVGKQTGFRATGAVARERPPLLAWLTVLVFAINGIALVVAPLLGPLDVWSGVAMFWAIVNMALLWGITKLTVVETFGRLQRVPEPSDRVLGAPAEPAAPTHVLGRFDKPPLPESVVTEFGTAMRALGYGAEV